MQKIRGLMAFGLGMILVLAGSASAENGTFKISPEKLKDKIKGGWAGQTIGCTFGGPTEFVYPGAIVEDYVPIPWTRSTMPASFRDIPGLYDDIYMDLTFVDIFEKEGLDAPADSFAKAFANADYHLWHANQAARYNILNGIRPPDSGHWLNNPHADDIDFQIEADFAGLMSPGMVNTSAEICDRIGHIMNYGDGWYGGVYVAAMYSLAFVSDDVEDIASQALKVIPPASKFAQVMKDVIQWHRENPGDWKETWFRVQRKWSEDVGCPDLVFSPGGIDAKINSAWVLMGLLYGGKDFGRTVSIAARCGDDSDCNPATAAGILGVVLGYDGIPAFWKQGLAEIEAQNFKYTDISLNRVYDLSFKHALEVIRRNGGRAGEGEIEIAKQAPKPVKLEIGFDGHYPIEKKRLGAALTGETALDFEGIGFVVNGNVVKTGDTEYVFKVEVSIDGRTIETVNLPSLVTQRRESLFWRYRLQPGKHHVKFKVLNPTDTAAIELTYALIYGDRPSRPAY
jgi:hypothetical protein